MILRIEELGPREASRFDQGQHLECTRQSGTRAQAHTWASSSLCGCEGSASDLLARALLQAPFPASALPGLSLLGSQVQKSSFLKKKKKIPSYLKQLLLTLATALTCLLQIKGPTLPFHQAQERGQPAWGTHARPAESGGGPREEGKAIILLWLPGWWGQRGTGHVL